MGIGVPAGSVCCGSQSLEIPCGCQHPESRASTYPKRERGAAALQRQRTGPALTFRLARHVICSGGWLRSRAGFLEDIDHLLIECRNVGGLAAGDKDSVDDHFLIHPAGSGMNEIGLERRP